MFAPLRPGALAGRRARDTAHATKLRARTTLPVPDVHAVCYALSFVLCIGDYIDY